MWMIEVLGLLCEWVTYYCYLNVEKPSIILSFIIHMNAYDRWAFFYMITTLSKMNERLRISIKFLVFLLCGKELHKMMELIKN
jgi:hypothetical protein